MPHHLGYTVAAGPDGQEEHDCFTCHHCQAIVEIEQAPRPKGAFLLKVDGTLCKICMKPICPRCIAKGGCTPWEKQMESIEARDRFLRSAGL